MFRSQKPEGSADNSFAFVSANFFLSLFIENIFNKKNESYVKNIKFLFNSKMIFNAKKLPN
jgi:hypothetical protein